MKCFVVAVLSFAVATQASPLGFGLGGLGTGIGTGLGGVGLGLGAGGLGTGVIGGGLGTGISNGLVNGLGNGLGLAGIGGQQQFASGVNSAAGANQGGFYGAGANGFHDRGGSSNRVTSITTAEHHDGHDVGAQNNFGQGSNAGQAYNNFNQGANGFGSLY